MDNITKNKIDNAGGIYKLYFAYSDEVDEIPSEDKDFIVSDDIVMASGKTFFNLEFALGKGGFEERQAEDEHGEYFKPFIKLVFPKDTPALRKALRQAKTRRFICVIIDNNGYSKIVGTLRQPLELKKDYTTNESLSGFNNYNLVFSGETTNEAPFYSGTIIVSGTSISVSSGVAETVSVGGFWYIGSGAPSSSLGKNGDAYLDSLTNYYYQKISNAWVYKGAIQADSDIEDFALMTATLQLSGNLNFS